MRRNERERERERDLNQKILAKDRYLKRAYGKAYVLKQVDLYTRTTPPAKKKSKYEDLQTNVQFEANWHMHAYQRKKLKKKKKTTQENKTEKRKQNKSNKQ